jgi:hypothetical protein
MATADGPSPGMFGGTRGNTVAFDASGKFAYVGGASSMLVYRVDLVTGALTPVGPPVARSQGAISVAVASVIEPTPACYAMESAVYSEALRVVPYIHSFALKLASFSVGFPNRKSAHATPIGDSPDRS